MKIAILIFSLVLSGQASIASAATPIFQLAPRATDTLSSVQRPEDNARFSSSNMERVSFEKSTPVAYRTGPVSSAITPHVVFAALEESHEVWPHADATTTAFPSDQKTVTSVNVVDDSLYYFLRSFKRQPPPKPELWTLLLVGLCLVLYQTRRRPMRASIGFFQKSKLVG